MCNDFKGIARATELAKSTVRVGEGAYRESIQITNGVSVLGGHQRLTWVETQWPSQVY